MEPSKAVKKYKDENKELYLKLDEYAYNVPSKNNQIKKNIYS